MRKGNWRAILSVALKFVFGFAVLAVGGTAIKAQNVNDDLKPASEPKAKVKTTAKAQPKVKTKKIVQPKTINRKSVNTKAAPRSFVERRFVSSETPDQIINRYMNFQQSAGVTERDWRSVVAQTTKILEANPNNSMAKAQSLIAQGQMALNQRNYAKALSYFKSVLQILPQSSLPHYSLGKAYLANGQVAAAERSFKTAIEQNENFALAYKGMGDALNAQGDQKKATKFFKRATEISVRGGNMPL